MGASKREFMKDRQKFDEGISGMINQYQPQEPYPNNLKSEFYQREYERKQQPKTRGTHVTK